MGETPKPSSPSTRISSVFDGVISSVWVARTCSTSLVPMPKASAPSAPCAAVWLSPQTSGRAGQGEALLGPDDVDDALLGARARRNRGRRTRRRCSSSAASCVALAGIVDRQSVRRWPSTRAGRRQIVIGDRERQVGPAHLAAGGAQAFERLRARSPRGPGAGRYRSGRCRRRAARRRARPRSSRTGCAGARSSAAPAVHRDQLAIGARAAKPRVEIARAPARRIPSRSRFRRDRRCGSLRARSASSASDEHSAAVAQARARSSIITALAIAPAGLATFEPGDAAAPSRGSARTGRVRLRRRWPSRAVRSSRRSPRARRTGCRRTYSR